MSQVFLRPMSSEEFTPWKSQSEEEYARDKQTQGLSEEEARAVAEKSTSTLLPQGLRSPDQYLSMVVDSISQEVVGSLWWGVQRESKEPLAWIYNIRIDEKHRSIGYGRAAMIAAEADVKGKGFTRFGLHVFGYNLAARKLYQSLGFAEINVVMHKQLAP
ncbi:MAG: GNAT family N-acetyltransferase [Proteobacteria bacterium]|nr:MAG: GNAT family N-acetyltransferase [Pseudomonadota bacterium]